MLEPGHVVGAYRVLGEVGRGGFATVYRARHEALGSLHALKVLRGDLVQSEDARERFLAEGRIQAQLRHPNITAVTDIVVAPGVAGLVMDFLVGITLHDRLAQVDGPLPVDEIASILRPAIEAVGYAHAHGVVHRDLKPANLFLCNEPGGGMRPRVLDFGIAKIGRGAFGGEDRGVTGTGVRMGTPQYMSPEQVRSVADVDHRSDIFSLGVILYEMATGSVAFRRPSEFDTLRAIVDGDWVPPARIPGALRLFDRCIRRAMAPEPEHRWEDAAALLAEFDAAIERGASAVGPGAPGADEIGLLAERWREGESWQGERLRALVAPWVRALAYSALEPASAYRACRGSDRGLEALIASLAPGRPVLPAIYELVGEQVACRRTQGAPVSPARAAQLDQARRAIPAAMATLAYAYVRGGSASPALLDARYALKRFLVARGSRMSFVDDRPSGDLRWLPLFEADQPFAAREVFGMELFGRPEVCQDLVEFAPYAATLRELARAPDEPLLAWMR